MAEQALINLDEPIGRVVGRRKAPDPLKVDTSLVESAKAWASLTRGRGLPKGVHRFHTHEEADEWTIRMITRPRE